MDPFVIVLLAVFIGIPVLSIIVMGVFAATSRFTFVEIRVRGGSMRGVVASAVARVLVKDTGTIQLPLEVVLQKEGLLGSSTPLFGGASVQDIEAWVYMDGEHVSTVTEAHSTRIKGFEERLVLPINVDVHLPKGVIRAYRDYRAKKRRAAEVELTVRGHVIVRHWFINRRIPVRLSKYVVLGDAVPRLTSVRWRTAAAVHEEVWDRAEVSVRLDNGYRDEDLEGTLRFELRRRRRMLPDVLLATHGEPGVRIASKHHEIFLFTAWFVPSGDPVIAGGGVGPVGTPPLALGREVGEGDDEGVGQTPAGLVQEPEEGPPAQDAMAVCLRVYWNDQELAPEEVRVLGVPRAKNGPRLSTGLDAATKRKAVVRARLEPVDRHDRKARA